MEYKKEIKIALAGGDEENQKVLTSWDAISNYKKNVSYDFINFEFFFLVKYRIKLIKIIKKWNFNKLLNMKPTFFEILQVIYIIQTLWK